MERHAQYLDQLIEFCDKTEHEPPERQFVFSYEHSWPFDYYERTRPKAKFEKLMEVCRRGQIEVNALYAGVHTDLCGHEELARLTAYAASLRKRFGIRVDGALLDDVSEQYTMGLPQVLARSGIRGICLGRGSKRSSAASSRTCPAVLLDHARRQPRAGGLDAGLLDVCRRQRGGLQRSGNHPGVRSPGQGLSLRRHLPPRRLRRQRPAQRGDAEKVLSERQQRAYPDVRMARVGDFAAYILDHFSKDLPSFQGDNPSSWADGTISLARETGVHRRSQSGVIEAEKLAALDAAAGGQAAYPAQAIRDVYRDLHLYSEHTWGLDVAGEPSMDVNSTNFAQWQKNWDAKRAYPLDAQRLVAAVRDRAFSGLNARIASAGLGVVVWNSSSWPKSDVVGLNWDDRLGDQFALVDARSGKEVPWQKSAAEAGKPRLVFLAENVPPIGYAVSASRSGPPAT